MDVSKNIDLKTELCLLFIMLILQFSLSSYSESYSCQHDLGVHCISKKTIHQNYLHIRIVEWVQNSNTDF